VKAGSAQPRAVPLPAPPGRHQRFRHVTGRRSGPKRPAAVCGRNRCGQVAGSGWTEWERGWSPKRGVDKSSLGSWLHSSLAIRRLGPVLRCVDARTRCTAAYGQGEVVGRFSRPERHRKRAGKLRRRAAAEFPAAGAGAAHQGRQKAVKRNLWITGWSSATAKPAVCSSGSRTSAAAAAPSSRPDRAAGRSAGHRRWRDRLSQGKGFPAKGRPAG